MYEKNSREKHDWLNVANTAVGLIAGVGIQFAVFAEFATSISYRYRLVVGDRGER